VRRQAPTRDRFEGCLLGLALGDALGAPHEGGLLERCVWRLIGKTRQGEMRWTDDTQMSLDLAESLIAGGAVDPDDLARRFAGSYRWSRGYGPGAARILKRIGRGADWRALPAACVRKDARVRGRMRRRCRHDRRHGRCDLGSANGATSLPADRLLKLEQGDRLRAVAGALYEVTT